MGQLFFTAAAKISPFWQVAKKSPPPAATASGPTASQPAAPPPASQRPTASQPAAHSGPPAVAHSGPTAARQRPAPPPASQPASGPPAARQRPPRPASQRPASQRPASGPPPPLAVAVTTAPWWPHVARCGLGGGGGGHGKGQPLRRLTGHPRPLFERPKRPRSARQCRGGQFISARKFSQFRFMYIESQPKKWPGIAIDLGLCLYATNYK